MLKKTIYFFLLFVVTTTFGDTLVAHEAVQERLLLIVGCGRGGTKYTSKLLSEAGLEIGHEMVRKDGCCSWFMGENFVNPHVENKKYKFTHTFHQVRNPLKVIASTHNFLDISWIFITSHVPEIQLTDPLLVRCAKYWVYWNMRCEAIAEWTYRIEDINDAFYDIQDRLSVKLNPNALKKISKETNTRPYPVPNITWGFLKKKLDPQLYHQVKLLAEHYGY